MKHLVLLPCLLACATTVPEAPPRIYDFSARRLAELTEPANLTSPKSQVRAMLAHERDAIAACQLTGTYQTDFTIELGTMTQVSVTPAAPCLEAVLRDADVSRIASDAPLRVTFPLVLEYAATP